MNKELIVSRGLKPYTAQKGQLLQATPDVDRVLDPVHVAPPPEGEGQLHARYWSQILSPLSHPQLLVCQAHHPPFWTVWLVHEEVQ